MLIFIILQEDMRMTGRKWALCFYLYQVTIVFAMWVGLLFLVKTTDWISFLVGGLAYLVIQAGFLACCFYYVGAQTIKQQMRNMYWAEAVRLIALGASAYWALSVYPLQMLFFLLGWGLPHTAYVWAPLLIERKNHD